MTCQQEVLENIQRLWGTDSSEWTDYDHKFDLNNDNHINIQDSVLFGQMTEEDCCNLLGKKYAGDTVTFTPENVNPGLGNTVTEYLWKYDETLYTRLPASPNLVIANVTAGTHNIEVKVVNSCGAISLTRTTTFTVIPPEGPGFDITVDVPGLLPDSTLYVLEVERIPFTDTWLSLPLVSGIRWYNISNQVYKAKVLRADCVPEPDLHSGFRIGQDYVIYVGTSSVSLYPGRLIHRSSDAVVSVDITESYVDWISNEICSAFDISSDQCSNFVFTSVNDAAFLLELWMIITQHKNLAGEETLPTALDYALIPIAILGIFSPGISEGKIAQEVGKRLSELIKISKTGPDGIKLVLRDSTIDKFMLRATETQFDNFINYMKAGDDILAKSILDLVEAAPMSVNEINALQRGSRLVNKIDGSLIDASSVELTSSILFKFSSAFKTIYHNAIEWAVLHPFEVVIPGIGIPAMAAMWYMIDKAPDSIDSYFKSTGTPMSSTSWIGKDKVSIIDQYKYNVIGAEKISDWDLFCENLVLWEEQVDNFEQFIVDNKGVLELEQTYDLFVDTVTAYRKAIELKNEVHSCGLDVLPESFKAEVIEIIDGDTVDIKYNDKVYRVRLLGINTPESKTYKNYSCIPGTHPFLVRRLEVVGGDCGDEEIWYTNQDNYDETVKWLGDPEGGNIPARSEITLYSDKDDQYDKYGRLLALIINKDGDSVNLKSLSTGQSVIFLYSPNALISTYTSIFLAEETVAKDANIGIWPFKTGTGSIRCVSHPTNSEVWLNGEYTGHNTSSSTYTLENVLIGSHTITFKKYIDDVLNSCSETVTVKLNEEVIAECTLTGGVVTEDAIWNIGAVKNEAGETLGAAKVWVDGIYTGHYADEILTFCADCTCDTVIPCGFGEHTVTITRTGYADWTKTRTLAAGDVFTDNPVMLPPTFPITIESTPTGATIKVDGELQTISISRIGGLNLIEQILKEYPVTEPTDTEIFLRKLNQLR